MSGNLKPAREMSGKLLTVRELSGNKPCHGKGHQKLVVASCIFAFIQVFRSIQLMQLILHNEVMLKFTFWSLTLTLVIQACCEYHLMWAWVPRIVREFCSVWRVVTLIIASFGCVFHEDSFMRWKRWPWNAPKILQVSAPMEAWSAPNCAMWKVWRWIVSFLPVTRAKMFKIWDNFFHCTVLHGTA